MGQAVRAHVVEAERQVATAVEHPLQREHLRMGRRELQQEGGVREREVLRGEAVVLHVARSVAYGPSGPRDIPDRQTALRTAGRAVCGSRPARALEGGHPYRPLSLGQATLGRA